MNALLEVSNLEVSFPGDAGWHTVVDGVSFELSRGSALGIVGESGSGKTVTALAIPGLTASQGGRISGGSVLLNGVELVGASQRKLARVRGGEVGVIFQQPSRSLDPSFTVGDQIAEAVRRHRGLSRRQAWQCAVEMLDRVHIADAARRAKAYPHELSGGMCQRVMIAGALACKPQLLIADEPTTALDVTVQARILELLREIQDEIGIAILFISHDLSVVADICDSVVVMYAGQLVERGKIEELFSRPTHPYTRGLLDAIPSSRSGGRYRSISGSVPLPGQYPAGCRFHPRCSHALPGVCDRDGLLPHRTAAGQVTLCVRAGELRLEGVSR